MNPPGVLLDTGPLVALLAKNDANHARAQRLFGACAAPLRTCEAVLAEACFLLRKVHHHAPAEVMALGARGAFTVAIAVGEHWNELGFLLKKYADVPISLADASLIQCAALHREPRILTFDADFSRYRWSRNRRFEILQSG